MSGGPRDARELLPPAVTGRLSMDVSDQTGRKLVRSGAEYEAFEAETDRYAWAAGDGDGRFVSFVLGGDADGRWLPLATSVREHGTLAYAKLAAQKRCLEALGVEIGGIGVRR